jgi:hypothetical protein
VRFVYLDEAGIANIEHDPHVVVLGVIVHADRQWKQIKRHLVSLVDKHIRAEHREGFYFHVKELRNGGKHLPRHSYSHEEQQAIISDLCSIPRLFDLPLICSYVDRKLLIKHKGADDKSNLTVSAQVVAASSCAMMIERYMREATPVQDEEVATMVFDFNADTRRLIKEAHRYFRSQWAADIATSMGGPAAALSLPLERIADEPHFVEQSAGSILQVADACVYATKRHLAGQDRDGFFNLIKDNFFLGPSRVFKGLDG